MKFFLILFCAVCSYLHANLLREPRDLGLVLHEIFQKELTMVTQERFHTIDLISSIFKQEDIPGDVAEFGVWRGGMGIYLAYAFPERKVWVGDSFQGFETLDHCKYDPRGKLFERHSDGDLKVDEAIVRKSFADMDLDETTHVEFLPGWVNDTTDPTTCPIKQLAILRIDVDAYSATLVTLENLYNKVVPGGFIIFDDSCLYETKNAIMEFEHKTGIEIVKNLLDPYGNNHGFFDDTPGLLYRKPKS